MIYFFSDLDSTLVYSHRHTLPGERVVVEYLHDHIQSYMTKKTYDFLLQSEDIFLIPTTTRTVEQYSRLAETFSRFGCEYALVCNGGLLLVNNEIDQEWFEETRRMAGNELSSLEKADELIHRMYQSKSVHSIKDLMVYVKTETPPEDADKIAKQVDLTKLNVYFDKHKVYCIPASINKGSAIRRFSERMGINWSVAAGDSIPDIPMLNAANAAILPAEIDKSVANNQKYVTDDSNIFSDYICDALAGLKNNIPLSEL